MKSNKDSRGGRMGFDSEDSLRRAAKLEPLRKSGKEKRAMFSELDEDEDLDLSYRKRESALDYFDDGEEDPEDAEYDDADDEYDEDFEEDEDSEDEISER